MAHCSRFIMPLLGGFDTTLKHYLAVKSVRKNRKLRVASVASPPSAARDIQLIKQNLTIYNPQKCMTSCGAMQSRNKSSMENKCDKKAGRRLCLVKINHA